MTVVPATWRDWFAGRVLLLALAFTLLNAFKPITIDDPTYFAFARQIASDPLDPYGLVWFWYEDLEPANHVLAPAVFLYYLAGVMRLFGESVVVLKLALFPWAWLLVFALDRLLTRFAPGRRTPFLVASVLSPALVPGFNLMLDIPALALALVAVLAFLRTRETGSLVRAVLAGVLLGLAMQTKYTAFVVPGVILWAVLLRGHWLSGLVSVATGVALFAGWEACLVAKYGESHFLLSAGGQGGILGLLDRAVSMVPFFLSHLGGLGCVWLLIGLWVLPAPRWLVGVTGAVVAGTFVVLLLWDARLTNDTRLSPMLFGPSEPMTEVIQPVEPIFIALGAGLMLVLVLGSVRMWRTAEKASERQALLFLLGWLLLEAAGSLVLSPFPAGRRLFGFLAVVPLLLARLAERSVPVPASRAGLSWLVAAQVLLGLGFGALDLHGARVHQTAAHQAASWIAESGDARGTVWFVGHWGFQFHAQQAGMRQLRSDIAKTPDRVEAGDWLVIPDSRVEQQRVRLPADAVELRHTLTVPAVVPVRTVACYHGGRLPIEHFEGAALEVRIYQARRGFVPHFGEPEKWHTGY